MDDVALFPIPGCVSFPGVPQVLHVFEPRYRQMVHECIAEGRWIGVCHTEKAVHRNDARQTVEQALSSNQSTYKPCEVFSAGPVQVLRELDDGRLLIQVDITTRLRLLQEKQTLPYAIWSCEELPDRASDDREEADLLQIKEKLLQRLVTITHTDERAQEALLGEHWQDMPVHAFSFAVAGLISMDAEVEQQLLEMREPGRRLEAVLDLVNTITPGLS